MNTFAPSPAFLYRTSDRRPTVLDIPRPVGSPLGERPPHKPFKGYSLRKRIVIALWLILLTYAANELAGGALGKISLGCG